MDVRESVSLVLGFFVQASLEKHQHAILEELIER